MKLFIASFVHCTNSSVIIFSSSSSSFVFNTSGIFITSITSIFEFIFVSSASFFISSMYFFANSLFIAMFLPLSLLFAKVINTSTFPLTIELDMSFFIVSSKKLKFLGIFINTSLYLLFTDFISTEYSLKSFSYLPLPYPVILLNIYLFSFIFSF